MTWRIDRLWTLAIVLGLAVVIGACASSSEDLANQELLIPVATPTFTSTPVADPTTTPIAAPPTEQPEPQTTPADEQPYVGEPFQVWFPKDPESFQDPAVMFAVERSLTPPNAQDRERRLKAILQAWIDGPTEQELLAGFLSAVPPTLYSPTCPSFTFNLDLSPDLAVVTFCEPVRTAGVGADARIRSSFEQTMAAAGEAGSLLLSQAGERCFGSQNDDDPLSCLPEDVLQGFSCPEGDVAALVLGTIIGAQGESVMARFGPTIFAPVIGQLNAGQQVNIYGSSSSKRGDATSWLAVQAASTGRCVYVATEAVRVEEGS